MVRICEEFLNIFSTAFHSDLLNLLIYDFFLYFEGYYGNPGFIQPPLVGIGLSYPPFG